MTLLVRSLQTLGPGIALLASFITPALAAAELPEAAAACLECHGDDSLTSTDSTGREHSVHVDGASYLASVHGKRLICTDCHEGYEDHPEPKSWASRRDFSLASAGLCKKCHFDTYTRALEGVHYGLLRDGSTDAPVCTDCHGAHDTPDPHQKRAMVSRSCGTCHADIAEEYQRSVHGAALEADNPDVPACADCHTAHGIARAKEAAFHIASPALCIRCHGDESRMARYGLAPEVAETYLADFHGVTASLADPATLPPDKVVVVCIDCHGHHSIESPALTGAAKMKARVESVCKRCHQKPGDDFPAAWLSHYRPSLQHAPLVFLISIFYRFLIPFMIIGLALQVVLHFSRAAHRRPS